MEYGLFLICAAIWVCGSVLVRVYIYPGKVGEGSSTLYPNNFYTFYIYPKIARVAPWFEYRY